ncbi:hypothetical protein BASA81_014469 [Batrachochytrium salamandrivorans]|nr:hypothetical protein BASA81_014469 [Batrachochytrium salamandrivorans]
MLSRLIITFLCAAAIGSVSGAFLTFDPELIVFENIDAPISFSTKLNSKPTEEVAVYFEHPFMTLSTCAMIFRPDNWDVPQQLTATPAPLFMTSTRDIEVQVFTDKCTEELSCPTKVLVRYGSSVMGMDVSGPVKNISEYSVTKVTQSTRGLRYIPGAKAGEHKINFSYGSDLYLTVLNNDGIIAAALLRVSPRKAPDDDGISTAFYQAALYMPANTPQGVPPTPFACALLRVCGQVFASATIPRAWLCASIVSTDKKDGDPLNPGDWAISETCITSSKFRFTVPGFDVIQHPATGPGRRGIALGISSCFGGHERNLLHQQ